MRVLLFDARNIFSPQVFTLIPPQIQVYQLSNVYPTLKSIDRTRFVYSLTPKMDHVRSINPSRGYIAFVGPLKFLDF